MLGSCTASIGALAGKGALWDFMTSCGSLSTLGVVHPAQLILANTWRRRQRLPCSGQDVPSPVVTLQIFFFNP